MFHYIKIEWLKLRKYPAFWVMFGIVTLTYPGVNMMMHSIYSQMTGGKGVEFQMMKQLIGNPFAFPETWHTIAYFSSFFLIAPAILVIMIIANEYTYKTHRQNIIDGWSRNEFVLSKMIDVLIISVIVTVLYSVVAAIFGFSYSSEFEVTRWAEQIKYIPLFFLQTFAQLTVAFLAGFLLKRSFIALGLFVFYLHVIEPILVGLTKYKFLLPRLSAFYPLEISDKLVPSVYFVNRFDKAGYEQNLYDINYHVLYTIILTALIWLLCFKSYNSRDL